MHLISQNDIKNVPSAEELAAKILNHLRDMGAAESRLALGKIIDTLVANQSIIRPTKSKR
jgi:hypothetical protein